MTAPTRDRKAPAARKAPAPRKAPRRRSPRFDTSIKHVTIHGHKRAYRMCGSGPALLLLHGIADNSAAWEPLMPALAERFTVIAPDLLGHGASDKPRADYSVAAYANGMRDLLTVLGIEHATVVGHSLGGGVAAQIGYQYPELCDRLVLVATGGVAREVSPVLRIATAPLVELTLPLLGIPLVRSAGHVALELLRRAGHDIGRDVDEVMRVFDGMPDGGARVAFTRTLRSVVDWRGQVVTMLDRAYLAESVPMLLVWGEHDGIIPVAHGHLAHDAIRGSRLEVFPEAGHFPHHTDPERFVSLLFEFVDETRPASHDGVRRRDLLISGKPEGSATSAA